MNEIRHTFDIVRKNTDFLQQQEPEIIAKPIWLIFSLALLSFQSSPLHNMNEAHNIKSCNYCFLFFFWRQHLKKLGSSMLRHKSFRSIFAQWEDQHVRVCLMFDKIMFNSIRCF